MTDWILLIILKFTSLFIMGFKGGTDFNYRVLYTKYFDNIEDVEFVSCCMRRMTLF